MKKLLTVLCILALIAGTAFAGDNNKITAGFGVGVGGAFANTAATIKGPSDQDMDLAFNGLDIIDLEGRLFFNRSNVAAMVRINGSVAFFKDSDTKDVFSAGTHIGTYIGGGYRIRPAEGLSLIPSVVLGVNELTASGEIGLADVEVELTTVCAGIDFACLYQLSSKLNLEASILATVDLAGIGEYSGKSGGHKTSFDLEGESGKITTTAKLGLAWLF